MNGIELRDRGSSPPSAKAASPTRACRACCPATRCCDLDSSSRADRLNSADRLLAGWPHRRSAHPLVGVVLMASSISMLNFVWVAFILIGFVAAVVQLLQGDLAIFARAGGAVRQRQDRLRGLYRPGRHHVPVAAS